MEGLSDRQIKLLEEYALGERSMSALLIDYEVRPRELREWRENPVFAKELETIEDFHTFSRECDLRKGAMQYVRRTREGFGGENRMVSARQSREGWKMYDRARQGDKHLIQKRGPHKIVFVNPVHPAYADTALGLVERLESLQRKAAARKEVKALPAPTVKKD